MEYICICIYPLNLHILQVLVILTHICLHNHGPPVADDISTRIPVLIHMAMSINLDALHQRTDEVRKLVIKVFGECHDLSWLIQDLCLKYDKFVVTIFHKLDSRGCA